MSGGLVCTHPGKIGDVLFSMSVVRELSKALGPALVITSAYCAPVAPLLLDLPYVRGVVVLSEQQYRPEHDHYGVQPWQMPVLIAGEPPAQVFHLGFRHFPRAGQTIPELAGEPYGIDPPPGPWLPLVRMDPRGPVAVPANTRPADMEWMLEQARRVGQGVRLIGTAGELAHINGWGEELHGGSVIVSNFREIHAALHGCSLFCGVNSGPSIVAMGAGLPVRWPHRPDVEQERWAAHGCDVTTVDQAGVVRRLRAP